jgi:aspartate 1-decarboxylase
MLKEALRSKIHRCTVTDANLNYEGSITLDLHLMELVGIQEWDKVQVVNLNNGERFETYAIVGKPNSGDICVNGAAARLVQIGDILIVMAFGFFNEAESVGLQPRIVKVDGRNRPI